ncbi:glycosyltransferase family 4 protein [Paenibacillus sp. BC26]|uniref:glycosyltransferase family 4 protein n=1 Tax=Paenibacillus sp. BC26 TaxID=1881032 RepID=UPI0008F43A2F|nr:glycosyltransferase family 4 protein [Paenibacillus sp. BC26]SFT25338.1 Glycosyltransferase involved in cell wall bisynthesis [Paenibacillus sp. BC26]
MNVNHICFIVPNYPRPDDPVYTFVRQLVCSIADQGVKCSVIAPQSVTKIFFKKAKKRPLFWEDLSENKNVIDVYQPLYFSFSNYKLLNMNPSNIFIQRAVTKAFNGIKSKPDVLYAHFWHNGVIAGSIGEMKSIPVFVATGESKIWVKDLYSDKKIHKSLKDIKGVICVSSKNMQESIELKLAVKEKMTVIPNSINNKLFHPINKSEIRKKLNFNENDFIVAFTGSFNHRKGVMRLSEAVQKVNGVKSIFIGSGELKPTETGNLFTGRLPHNDIVDYLNAANVFVLPTLAEGCSNAIIEAMACGLPIISSDLPFNDDILDVSNSIRVDSNNIDEIASAIQYLKDNSERQATMSEASKIKAKELDINNRAKRIIEFINLNL